MDAQIGVSPQEIVSLFGFRNASLSRDELTCSCPFTQNHAHGDRNPSFGMNVNTGLWLCRACGEKGNLPQLAERVLGMSRIDALRTFSVDITPDTVDRLMDDGYEAPKPMTPMQMDISRWCSNKHEYWHQRGFVDETIGRWHLGYDPEENRVVVPVYKDGELMGWSKRAVNDVDQPKWRHSPDMEKSRLLFGQDNFTGDTAIVVEAPLSVIMLDQYGVSNAVATFGCKMSDAQARMLRANYNNVLIWYDPDQPGQDGMADAVGKLEDFVDVYVVPPTRDDPAGMTMEEDLAALQSATPLWAADWVNVSKGKTGRG